MGYLCFSDFLSQTSELHELQEENITGLKMTEENYEECFSHAALKDNRNH